MRRGLTLCLLALALAGCGAPERRYYLGSFGRGGELGELFRLLDQQKGEESRFVIIQQIASTLASAGEREREIVFLTTHVGRNPDDPFNGYYLLMAAEACQDLRATPLAVHYYARVLNNEADLLVQGRSIHLHCLQQLVELESRPYERIGYYKELISRFGSEVEQPGSLYFLLARSYEEAGEWEQAIKAYQQYLTYPGTEVAGVSDAARVASEKVLFYYADPTWTVSNLSTLVAEVRDILRRKDLVKLRKYQAKVNFFAEAWNQQARSEEMPEEFEISNYLASSNPRVDADLDPTSNDRVAYLRTTNWSFRPTTWYLYFRRIDFPAKPEVNGQWEWAGIYFGERL